MATQTIKMPDIGEGIAEVELVAWHVKVGELVAEDQILADVMTDKATVEIPSHVAGKVLSLDVAVGQVVAVGTEIIHIETAAASVQPAQAAMNIEAIQAPVLPLAAPVAAPEQALVPPPVKAPERVIQTAPGRGEAALRPIAAPAVRRRAWELGIELASLQGSGPAGRITQDDLQAQAARSGPGQQATGADQRYAQRDGEEVIPVIGLRRKIAQKMQEAKRHIPHFTYVEEIDVTELEALRARLNAQYGKERGRLTMLPFLMRAIVLAVREFPQINARYDDEAAAVTRYQAVHLGLATQTENGLMVPVLRHAETLDLWASAAGVVRLAQAARSGRAAREELSGSTLTITSLGALGGIVSTPVINHPEVAIVGTNRMVERPMIRGGVVVPRLMMNLSSSFDHRVVDGMHGAEFVQLLRGYLECPATLFVDA